MRNGIFGGGFGGFEVYAETRIWHNSVCFWIHRVFDGQRHVVKPVAVVIERKEPDTAEILEPSLEIDRATATNLMTELWRLGYRPNVPQISGSGELEATKAHLEDLRNIVFEREMKPRAIAP